MRTGLQRVIIAIAALALGCSGLASGAAATPWPLAAAEVSRIDLAALTGVEPAPLPRSSVAAVEGAGQRRAGKAPQALVDRLMARLGTWLDSSDRDFQVLMRRLSTPSSAAGPWPSAPAGAGEGVRVASLEDSGGGVRPGPGVRIAQAGKTGGVQAPAAHAPSSAIEDALAPVTDWLEKSAQDFQSVIMKRLSVPSGEPAPAAAAADERKRSAPVAKEGGSVSERIGGAAQSAKDWLDQSKRDFQERILGNLTKPDAGAQTGAAQPPAAATPPAKLAPAVQANADEAVRKKAEEDQRAAKAAVDAAERKVRELRIEDDKRKSKAAEQPGAKADARARDASEEAQRRKVAVEESARRAAAEQKRADEAAAAAAKTAAEARAAANTEAVRKAEEARKKADAARMADEASRAGDALLAAPRTGSRAPHAMGVAGPPPAALAKNAAGSQAETAQRPETIAQADVARSRGGAAHGKAARRGSCRAAGHKVKPPAVYVVARGDSLWVIARRHYKKGTRWVAIHKANDHEIGDPDLIFPCQRFYMPKL